MRFIGIDPGLQGGIAFIEGSEIVTTYMPIIHGKKKTLDNLTLSSIFSGYDPTKCYAILEKQHSFPKQGVVSTCSICYGFGTLKQCLVDFGIPHEIIPAKDWQKEFGISGRKGDTKVQALRVCQGLFPNLNLLATERSRKPHEGVVDAVLIAEFARRRHGGDTKK